MKDLIELLTNDEKSFEWKWWVYMFVLPAALVGLMAIAGWLESICI